jgi:hypothetical protein
MVTCMKWLYVVAITSMAVLPGVSSSQPLYRCGNKYSQTPCDSDAKPARILNGAAPDQAQGAYGKDLCISEAPQKLGFPDPESTRFLSVTKGPAEVIKYADQPIVAHKYLMTINTKNAYGAYAGEQSYVCFLTEDEHRVFKIEPQTQSKTK